METGPKETPRACEACGGRGMDCKWCSGGFQDTEQQSEWRVFRSRMRKISGTYSLLEGIVKEIILKLREERTEEAGVLAERGEECLRRWTTAEAATDERRAASVDIGVFQNEALLLLMKAQ